MGTRAGVVLCFAVIFASVYLGQAALCPSDPSQPCATVDRLYDQLADLFGNQAQLLTMEFPGRTLDQATYWYNVSDSTSQYLKPQQVAEAEFRLVDSLFDVSQVTGGPNGRQLSVQYQLALNSLVPSWLDSQFRKDQQTIRDWVLSPMDSPQSLMNGDGRLDAEFDCTVDLFSDSGRSQFLQGDLSAASLIDVHTKLIERYEAVQMAWDLCKVEQEQKAIDNPAQRDAFFRWISVVGLSAKGKLDAFWQDVIVRGYHHEVMQAISYLDVKPAAEVLQDSRDLMRNAQTLSVDGSTVLYPVQLQPSNWAESLSTSFSPVDLLLDPDATMMQANQLQQQINTLVAQKAALEAAKEGDVGKLEAQVEKARAAVADAQTKMVEGYGSAVATFAKMYLDHKYGTEQAPQDAGQAMNDEMKKELPGAPPFTGADVDKIVGLWNSALENQQALTYASQALAVLQAALAAAHTTNQKEAIQLLATQIQSYTSQLNFLKTQIQIAGKGGQGNTTSLIPDSPQPGPWTTIILHTDSHTSSSTSRMTASASHSSWNLDLIFASGSGSSDSSSSTDSQSFKSSQVTLDIGFRATKVTIDRGGWFTPGMFAATSAMMSTTADPAVISDPSLITDTQSSIPSSVISQYSNMTLPTYPVSFIIARDVTIKITTDNEFTETSKEYMSSQSSSSGGFLCFSYATSSSSTSESSYAYSFLDSKSVLIKIPGPQILGWFMEFVPKSQPQQYAPMPQSYWPPIPPPKRSPVIETPTPKPAPKPKPRVPCDPVVPPTDPVDAPSNLGVAPPTCEALIFYANALKSGLCKSINLNNLWVCELAVGNPDIHLTFNGATDFHITAVRPQPNACREHAYIDGNFPGHFAMRAGAPARICNIDPTTYIPRLNAVPHYNNLNCRQSFQAVPVGKLPANQLGGWLTACDNSGCPNP